MATWTKIGVKDWIQQRLALEAASLWTDTERDELSEELAGRYRPGLGGWTAKPADQISPDGSSTVYVVTRGDMEIHTDDDLEKASAVARMLNNLDHAMSE
jgi:hypothetical protein